MKGQEMRVSVPQIEEIWLEEDTGCLAEGRLRP